MIGKKCKNVSVSQANDYIFGYTCFNDVTATGYLSDLTRNKDWARAKCGDGFSIFGPVIRTEFDYSKAIVTSKVEQDGEDIVCQQYSTKEMLHSPTELVSAISKELTLEPGDIISCGTSAGAAPMLEGWRVEISITGIGSLVNRFKRFQ